MAAVIRLLKVYLYATHVHQVTIVILMVVRLLQQYVQPVTIV